MIEALAPWIVALLVTLIGGGFGWSQVKKHGQEKERRVTAEKERDEAIKIAVARGSPLETLAERQRSALIELDRRMQRISKIPPWLRMSVKRRS